jgi:hypothetical protein
MTHPRLDYDVFFVLNGLMNGNDGEYARDLRERQLVDGWFYLIPESPSSDEPEGPFKSRQEACDAAQFEWERIEERRIEMEYEDNWDMSKELVKDPFDMWFTNIMRLPPAHWLGK